MRLCLTPTGNLWILTNKKGKKKTHLPKTSSQKKMGKPAQTKTSMMVK